LRFLLRLRLVRSANNVLLTWIRPSFSGFWLVLQRITPIGGKRCILQLRLQRIALTYRRIGLVLGLPRSYLRLGSRNLLACLRGRTCPKLLRLKCARAIQNALFSLGFTFLRRCKFCRHNRSSFTPSGNS
jgi:hypothetical protein